MQQPWSQDIDGWWRHLYLEDCSDKDENAEALHFCLTLRALGLARLPSLKDMKFSVRGPAFWTANRLGWLLNNGDHRQLRTIRACSDVSVIEAEAGISAEEEERDGSVINAYERRKLAHELDIIFDSA